MIPSRVVNDIQLRTVAAPPCAVIQPKPRPVPKETTTAVTTVIAPVTTAERATAFQVLPNFRASHMPAKPSATKPVTLTIPARLMSTIPPAYIAHDLPRLWFSCPIGPGSGSSSGTIDCAGPWIARRHSSRPTSRSASSRASLWIPPTRCSNTSGLSVPSQRVN